MLSPSRAAIVALCLCLCWLLPRHAMAHERSTSQSTWTLAGDHARVVLTIAERDVMSGMLGFDPSGGDGSALRETLLGSLRLSAPGGPCLPDRSTFRALAAPSGYLSWQWMARCPTQSDALTLESHLFEREAPNHLHVARIRAGGAVVELLLSGAERAATAQVGRAAPTGLWRALRLGMEHLASGLDHLVFLVALVASATSLRALGVTVTGFTLGHSLTLALGALGFVKPNVALVEALTGASIVVVAVERAWLQQKHRSVALPLAVVLGLGALGLTRDDPSVLRALLGAALFVGAYLGAVAQTSERAGLHAGLAALFGLIHGLGFASALWTRPPSSQELLPTLLGFNLGIEIAQLLVAAVAWGALVVLRKHLPRASGLLLDLASAAACGLGVHWAITRLS